MELRDDLEFSVSKYGNHSRGLLTLGDKKILELENGRKIELLPYIVDSEPLNRGVSDNDPRRKRANNKAIPYLAEAYADHYNNAGIDEHWTVEDATKMMNWHLGQSLGNLFFVKWARDLETNEEFPLGFFSAYAKPYQSGKILWDGELFVLPEYQRYGIGTELIEVVFQTAQAAGVNLFEALTYADEKGHPLSMWEKYGANVTDLAHITGEIPEMLDIIGEKSRK